MSQTGLAAMTCFRVFVVLAMVTVASTGVPTWSKKLTLDELSVPSIVDVRDEATLTCRFDVGSERLYSVKWYKDEFEFYRYMPDNLPPSQTFPVPGVTLNDALCSMHTVTLTRLSFASSGTYRCEVSTEAPNFETVFKNANMTVMALPQHDPMIEGVISTYSIGDFVRANCTSAKSNPPATLEWFINGIKADRWLLDQMPVADDLYRSNSQTTLGPEQRLQNQLRSANRLSTGKSSSSPILVDEWIEGNMPLREEVDAQGMYTRTLGLSFATERRFFQGPGDAMELRCVARVGDRVRERAVTSALATLSNNTISASRRFNSAFITSPCCTVMVILLCFLVTVLTS